MVVVAVEDFREFAKRSLPADKLLRRASVGAASVGADSVVGRAVMRELLDPPRRLLMPAEKREPPDDELLPRPPLCMYIIAAQEKE